MDDEQELSEPAEVVDEAFIIEAVPWHNGDTVSAMFAFAANQSIAAASLFQSMAQLALGQSTHEWHVNDREEFAEETVADIARLPEVKE